MLYAQRQIKLHEKSLDYLELITKANTAIEEHRNRLYRYDNAKSPFANIRLMYTRYEILMQQKKYAAIKEYLVKRYGLLLKKMFIEIMPQLNDKPQPNAVSIAEHSFNTEYAF